MPFPPSIQLIALADAVGSGTGNSAHWDVVELFPVQYGVRDLR